MLGNLIAGVVSGLFVTVSVFVFRIIWTSKMVPWFEERVYKDAKKENGSHCIRRLRVREKRSSV